MARTVTAKPKPKPIKRHRQPLMNKKSRGDDVIVSPMPRRLRLPAYKPFRLRRIRHPVRLPSALALLRQTSGTLWHNKRIFLGIALIYGLLNIMLVRGLGGGTDIGALKEQIATGFGGNPGQLVTGFTVYLTLLASSGNSSSSTAGSYQFILVLLVSLATIWAARQTMAGHKVRLRDAFYKGMYPLVPFTLVLIVVMLQLVPLIVGGVLYEVVATVGIAASTLELVLWGILALVLGLITVYMLCSSLFALYIATLPDMTPWRALKSARQLVRYRRGQVFRKLIFLPIALFVVATVIMLPLIWFADSVAPWVFFGLSMVSLIVVNVYMYTLYKALLA